MMFRGFMPALTLVVFTVGIGIGLAFSKGLIPLSLSSANTGKLSIEVTQRESLPPPNDRFSALESRTRQAAMEPPAVDPEVFENQSEPDSENGIVVTSNTVNAAGNHQPDGATTESDWAESDAAIQAASNKKGPITLRVRTRDHSAVQLDAKTGIEVDETPPQKSRRITTAAHQDPSESSNDARTSITPQTDTDKSPDELLDAAEAKRAAGETLAAHRDLSKIYWNHKEFRPRLQSSIDGTAKAIFFQSKPHFVEPYTVQEGDRLEVIAKKYQLSWEYLAKLNRTEPRRVQIGQKLKVMKGPFGAVVDLKDFSLTIHLQGYYVKQYQVGIGKDGSSPIGEFSVLNKLENPQYTGPTGKVVDSNDPTNPLGERWIDLGDSYGIHGTIDPDSIGKAESRGCIRLRDNDIIEVYDFLVKGSQVVIRQ